MSDSPRRDARDSEDSMRNLEMGQPMEVTSTVPSSYTYTRIKYLLAAKTIQEI